MEIPVDIIFSRELVDDHRGHWISLQNSGVTRKYNVPARWQRLSLVSANLVDCLVRSTVRSKLSIANIALVVVEHRAPAYKWPQPSILVKKSDLVLSVQSSLPESNKRLGSMTVE